MNLRGSRNYSTVFSNSNKLNFNENITLKNVSYSYGKSNNIFDEINIQINKGDHIGIYGKTGSGKSTLLDILMGLLPPNKGEILVDNVDIYKKIILILGLQKSHVPQIIFLKEGSIAENIAFGKTWENLNLELLNKASKAAGIYDFIKQTTNGFNTNVGKEELV